MPSPTDATRTARARARPGLLRQLARAGSLPCPRCPHPIYPWHDVDVGHETDVANGGANSPMRLEHRSCNREAGDRRPHRQPPDPAPPDITSREW